VTPKPFRQPRTRLTWPQRALCIGMGVLLSSCAHVQITDQEWCADKGTQGAFCAHTLTTTTRVIPKDQWDDLRFGQFCTADQPADAGKTLGEIKMWVEQLCTLSRRCDYSTQQAVMAFFRQMEMATAR
jgi:hypothetical protein